MAAHQATAEKSMEEILASIRETIEQDVEQKKQGGFMAHSTTAHSKSPEDHASEDVFELTQMVNEDGSVSEVEEDRDQSASQESQSTSSSVTDFAEDHFEATVASAQADAEASFLDEDENTQASNPATHVEPTERSSWEAPSQNKQEEGEPALVSDVVAQVAGEALSELSKAVSTKSLSTASAGEKTSPPTSQNLGQNTVEGLMRELLRPMLKDWLDAHLPSLVKWIVTEQIEKIIQEKKKDL